LTRLKLKLAPHPVIRLPQRLWWRSLPLCLLGLALGETLGPEAVAKPSTPDPSRNHAIVQLQGLAVPKPQVQGAGTLPLKPLEQTQVYTVQGSLGSLPGRFLIDTGASTTMIAPDVAQKLQLSGKAIPSKQLSSAVAGNECATMDATLHSLPLLRLGPVEIQNASGLRFEKTVMPEGLTGVVGTDILSQLDLQIKPQSQTLLLSPPTILPVSNVTTAIPLQRKLGVFLAKLILNGQGPFIMLLDTAADSTFISQSLARRLQLNPQTFKPMQILGFCGLEPAQRSQLASVKLQQYEQRNMEVIVATSAVLKQLGIDGILGQNFLNRYQQYWRFTPFSNAAIQGDGSLLLSPLSVPPPQPESSLPKP
jgi:predicted aspartyl protease